jgi:hypothetical protein
MWISGFSTSTPPASETSAPVTCFGPVASRRVSVGSPEGTFTASFFTFRRTSVVSSSTPLIFASTSLTSGIRTQVTAAPGTIASSVRRSECPTVRA